MEWFVIANAWYLHDIARPGRRKGGKRDLLRTLYTTFIYRQGLTCHQSTFFRDSKSVLFLQVAKASTSASLFFHTVVSFARENGGVSIKSKATSKWFKSGYLPVWSCIFKCHLEADIYLVLPRDARSSRILSYCSLFVSMSFWCTVYSNCAQSKHLFLENIRDAGISNTSRIGPHRCQQEVCQISIRGADDIGKQNQTNTYCAHVRAILLYVSLRRCHDKHRKSEDTVGKAGTWNVNG